MAEWLLEIARCDAEIAGLERLLRAGHPDIEGLTLGLSDWHQERRLLVALADASAKVDYTAR